jgi:L-lactate utilization protein LutC
MNSREAILSRIRDALGRSGSEAPNRDALRERTARHARHIEPVFSEPPEQRFQQKLEAAAATFTRVDVTGAVAAEFERYLAEHELPQKLVISGDPLIESIAWPASFDIAQRVPSGDDLIGVTTALYGIAETGTLMLVSGETRPISLNFLPDYHIVVIRREQLVARMEDAWDGLRQQPGGMPRTVNFISGPSKTADIEQTVEYGAHGPRCLHVIMVG